jgi:hypothetical protein
MDEKQGGGRGPEPDDTKRPAKQTEESAGAIKSPQHGVDQARDLSRGAEPSSGGASRRR